MARILFGIAGEGMGHCTRSETVIEHLSKRHKLFIITGSRSYKYLSGKYRNISHVWSLRTAYYNNSISDAGTLLLTLIRLPFYFYSLFKTLILAARFRPDVVVTDFDLFSAYTAIIFGIPLITADNEHIVTRGEVKFPQKFSLDAVSTRAMVHIINPFAEYHLITTFFYPRLRYKNCYLVPPILRKEILDAKTSEKDYILVYQTSQSYYALVPMLRKSKENFVVYGLDRTGRDGNVIFKRFNGKHFFEDLANCRAVIQNGGFTLMSEAIYLGKPILSIPVRRQFEQIINALYLNRSGYGMYSKWLTPDVLERFLSRLGEFRKNLKKYKREDNSRFFSKLNLMIAKLTRK